MANKKERKAYAKEERQMHIVTALAVNIQSGGEGRMTCQQIADALHMTASTHLRLLLNQLVADKILQVEQEPDPGIAGFRRIYSLHPETTFKKEIDKAAKRAGVKAKESKEDRDKRLMAAISKTNGQMSLFWERQEALS